MHLRMYEEIQHPTHRRVGLQRGSSHSSSHKLHLWVCCQPVSKGSHLLAVFLCFPQSSAPHHQLSFYQSYWLMLYSVFLKLWVRVLCLPITKFPESHFKVTRQLSCHLWRNTEKKIFIYLYFPCIRGKNILSYREESTKT